MDRITDSEQEVLQLLWEREPITATDLADQLGQTRGWSVSTVKTLLSRLVTKEAVAHVQDGRRFQYRALLTKDAFATNQSSRLIDGLFGGRAAPLVAHLARRNALSDEDIAEIEALLRELKT